MWAVSSIAVASEPGRELRALIREDAALIVEVQDLEKQISLAKESEFVRRLKSSELHRTWIESRAFQNLTKSRTSIEKATKKPFEQLASELFGSAVVVALFRTGAGGQCSAVLLTEADSVDVLDESIRLWNEAETQESTTLNHAGRNYVRRSRIRSDKEPELLYYAKLGRVFVLSDKEDLVRPVLELDAHRNSPGAAAAVRSIADSDQFQRSQSAIEQKPAAIAYINPRAWDEHFPLSENSSREERAIGQAWRRLDAVSLGFNLDQGPVFELHALYSPAGLTDEWRHSISRMQGRAEFLTRIPSDAVIAFAGRHDLPSLARLVAAAASAETDPEHWDSFRQVSRGLLLGLDLFDDVLPRFAPNYGGYGVAGNLQQTPETPPLDLLVAFNIPDAEHPANSRPSLRDALDNGLNTGLNLAAAYLNSAGAKVPVVVKSEKQTGGVLRWIEKLGPLRPGYALTGSHLAFATDAKLAERFVNALPTEEFARNPRLAHAVTRYFPNENQVAFVDVAALRILVANWQKQLNAPSRASESIPADDIAARVKRFLDVAGLVDSAFAAGHIAPDHVRLIIGGVVDPADAAVKPPKQ